MGDINFIRKIRRVALSKWLNTSFRWLLHRLPLYPASVLVIIVLFSRRAITETTRNLYFLSCLAAFRTGMHKIADYAIADGAIAYPLQQGLMQ